MLEPSIHKAILQVLSTWVLFAVFVCCAIAFALDVLGIRKVDPHARKYLYGVFGASVLGIFVTAATDVLEFNPSAIGNASERSAAREQVQAPQNTSVPGQPRSRVTIFTQIPAASQRQKYDALKAGLPRARYIVPAVEVRSGPSQNEIRYCNQDNSADATDLQTSLNALNLGQFRVVQISKCDRDKNKNILEVWFGSS